jgi:cAMP phosphodiesterase
VIQGLKKHLFNNTIWPDITKITNGKNPLLQFQTLHPKESTTIGEIELLPIAVNHSIPSVGLLLSQQDRSLLYTGDTAPTGEIWEVAAKTTDLSGLIIETSFPDRLHQIATISGHMTPSMLAGELKKMGRPEVPVYIFHMKPKYERIILEELNTLLGERVHVLKEGDVIQL